MTSLPPFDMYEPAYTGIGDQKNQSMKKFSEFFVNFMVMR